MKTKSLFLKVCYLFLAILFCHVSGSFSARAAFVLFENFNNLTQGALNGQNAWIGNVTAVTVAADPSNPANNVLSIANHTGADAFKLLGNLAITNGTTGTLFYRFRRADSQMNISHGLSDLTALTSPRNFADFEVQFQSNGTNPPNLNLRDAANARTVTQFTPDVWYCAWLHIDNSRDLYSVYLQGGQFATPTLLTNGSEYAFTFRNSTGDSVNNNTGPAANNLVSFMARSSSAQNHAGPFYVDDIYVDVSGTNLMNPAADTNAPVMVTVSPAPNTTVQFLTNITITFDEVVLNVAAANLLVNDTPATGLTGSGTTWTFVFPQPPEGPVTVAWAGNQTIADQAGNRFTGTNAWACTLLPPDVVPPVVASTQPSRDATITNWQQIAVTFSEPMLGVNATDLLINGTPALSVTNMSNTYYFTAAQALAGTLDFAFVTNHGITDLSGNPLDENAATNRWTSTFTDWQTPYTVVISPANSTVLTQFVTLDVTFNEPVLGIDASDLLINNMPATNVTGSGVGPYRFFFATPPMGIVPVTWSITHGITDLSGNPFAGGSWTNQLTFAIPGFVLFDNFENLNNGPINGQNGWITASSAFVVDADPENAANKVLSAQAMTESPLYKSLGRMTVSNNASATIFFRMRRANTLLNVSAGLSDLAAPTAAFTDYEAQLNINTTNANNLNVRDAGAFDVVDTFTFDTWYSVWMVVDNARDLVTVYMQGGALPTQTLLNGNTDGETSFTFRNSTADGFNSNSGPVANALTTFLVRVGGSHTGPYYVDDIYIDNAGANLSNPIGPDTIKPALVAVKPPFNAEMIELTSVTVTFHEPVIGVAAGDLLINGNPATNVAGSWTEWTYTFPTPVTGLVNVAWSPTHNITDATGNRFDQSSSYWTYINREKDTNAPIILSVSPATGSTLSNWPVIEVTFNEPIAGLDPFDLLINGTPATTVSNTGNTYYFVSATPAAGPVTLSFDPASGIVDAVGNPFATDRPGHSWNYTYVDTTPPFVAILTPLAGATLTHLETIDLSFNEPVSGVEAADLLVNGTPATNVTGSGSGPYRFTFAPTANGTVWFSWASGHGISDNASTPNAFLGGTWSNLVVTPSEQGTVIINEFLANNVKNLTNEFGSTEDWIELYNPGTTAVNLLGWSLTDDSKTPARWVFPSVIINPGQYLVVFADARDIQYPSGTNRLHTNFKINDQGGYLALFNADFPPVSPVSALAPGYPEQRPDYSFGLNSSNEWRYFATPTPGAPNGESTITGITATPHVSASRGLYNQPFTLVVSCAQPGAILRYTIDGSQPTENNGTVYSSPLVISNTTIFRVAAFATNSLPSRVSTHSYIFADQVLAQPNNPAGYPVGTNVWTGYPSDYEMDPEIITNNPAWVKDSLMALPSLCLSINVDDLFGATNGIYTHPEATPRELWERACSAEFILTNGQTGFQVDCGIRVQGNASRTPQKTPKHPFRLFFRGAYGPGTLDYPLFPQSPVQSFNTVVLRADFNGSWLHWNNVQREKAGKVRDAWTKMSFEEMTGTASHCRPFHLYLNGIYWGIYDFGERIDSEFAASYYGGSAEEWDAIASKPTEAIDGNITAYNQMVNAGRRSDMTQPANYMAIQQMLDMPVFMDYMILNFYGANNDWGFDGNWNAIYRRAPGSKFIYTVWDGELLAFFTNDNRVSLDIGGVGLGGNQGLPSGLHTNLIQSAEYRLNFADRVHKHCFNGGALTPDRASGRWMNRAMEVAPAILAESARWGDYRRDVHQYSVTPYALYTTNDYWWPEIERMRTTYFPVRTDIFVDQLRPVGLYPSNAAPVFSKHGGQVATGYLLNMSATNTIYYTTNGTDPRVPFTGAISPAAMVYTDAVAVSDTMTIKARTLDGTSWSALNEASFQVSKLGTALCITELMYNPLGGDAYEFIELRNAGNLPLDVSGWSFIGVSYTFPSGSILAPGQVIVLANNLNPAEFAVRYPGLTVYGWFGGRLDNNGERIAVTDTTGGIVLSVDYKDSMGWPKEADGNGYSLEIINPSGDADAAANWRVTSLYGTPGIIPALPVPSSIRISEIMADNATIVSNAGTWPDWIELQNTSASDVLLDNWSLSDDSNARKYLFPSNTVITAGGYLVIWCDTNTTLPGLHSGFNLDREGETVSLFNASTTRVDAVSYGLQLPD